MRRPTIPLKSDEFYWASNPSSCTNHLKVVQEQQTSSYKVDNTIYRQSSHCIYTTDAGTSLKLIASWPMEEPDPTNFCAFVFSQDVRLEKGMVIRATSGEWLKDRFLNVRFTAYKPDEFVHMGFYITGIPGCLYFMSDPYCWR